MVAQQDPVVGEIKSNKDCDNKTHHNMMMMMIKGKRTKRSRPMSPLALTMSSATATTTTDEGGASSATSEEFIPPPISTATATSEEEEDMAHCLILLAQGSNQKSNTHNSINIIPKGNNVTSSYECKTCNKSFSSFQALGGHRASHKKPKPTLTNTDHHHDNHLNHHHLDDDRTTMLSLQIYSSALLNNNNNNSNKAGNNKVHECGICGAEFSSGQALGGHMRRHRPIGTSATTNNKDVVTAATNNNMMKEEAVSSTSTRNLLSLDLNLPAPEDEVVHLHQLRDSSSNSKFVFPSNEKTLVFSAASQLVDCHY